MRGTLADFPRLPEGFDWDLNPTTERIEEMIQVRAQAWTAASNKQVYTYSSILEPLDESSSHLLIVKDQAVVGGLRIGFHADPTTYPFALIEPTKYQLEQGYYASRLAIHPEATGCGLAMKGYQAIEPYCRGQATAGVIYGVQGGAGEQVMINFGWQRLGYCNLKTRRLDETYLPSLFKQSFQ